MLWGYYCNYDMDEMLRATLYQGIIHFVHGTFCRSRSRSRSPSPVVSFFLSICVFVYLTVSFSSIPSSFTFSSPSLQTCLFISVGHVFSPFLSPSFDFCVFVQLSHSHHLFFLSAFSPFLFSPPLPSIYDILLCLLPFTLWTALSLFLFIYLYTRTSFITLFPPLKLF